MKALIFLALVQACRKYECVSLGSDICAKRAENSTLVNSSPCSANKRCLVKQLEALEGNPFSDTLYCEEFKSYDSYQWNRLAYQCGIRKTSRDFKSSKDLIRCRDHLDCQLKDASFTECVCGADGEKYCVPAWDSMVFDEFWKECKLGIFRDRMNFWMLFKQFYPLWVTSRNLDCIRGSVYEMNLMVLNENRKENYGRVFCIGLALVLSNFL